MIRTYANVPTCYKTDRFGTIIQIQIWLDAITCVLI